MKTKKKAVKTTKKVNKPKAKKATTKLNKAKKSTSKATKKVTKKPTKKSATKKTNTKKKATKKDKWSNIVITESGEIIDKSEKKETSTPMSFDGDGCYSDGHWNGSTRTDAQIAAIKNPRLKELAERIDKQQEEVKRAREDGDDPDYIANCVIELKRLRAQYEEIEREEG